jgi:hypothetical protein
VTREACLRGLLASYLGHDSFAKAAEQLRTHPELLGDEADAILLTDLDEAARRRDDNAELRLRQHLAFLRRCSRDGLDRIIQAASSDIDQPVELAPSQHGSVPPSTPAGRRPLVTHRSPLGVLPQKGTLLRRR